MAGTYREALAYRDSKQYRETEQVIVGASVGDQFTSGDAHVFYTQFAAGVGGFETLVFGTARVENWIRYLTPGSIKVDAYGALFASYLIRTVDLISNGPATQAFGTASFDLGNREVAPDWFVSLVFGTATMGYAISAEPSGWDQTEWGGAFVHDNSQFLLPTGITGEVGAHWITQLDRQVFPVGVWEADEFRIGYIQRVYNLNQIISAEYIETQWNLGSVSEDAHAYNENRELDLVNNGIAPRYQQIPITHQIFNNAQASESAGFDASLFGQQLVAYAIRDVTPPGVDSFIDGEFRVVYNAALEIRAQGWDQAIVPAPESVVKTRRYFPYWTVGEDQSAFGTAFVAPAIRTIAPSQDIGPERWGDQTTWFKIREIAPDGFQYTPFGTLVFDVRLNLVRPNTIQPANLYGRPKVTNRTPFVGPYWDEDSFTAFGGTAIFNQNNYYAIQGFGGSAFGLHYIADRKQTIFPPGFSNFRLDTLHRVRNDIPDPPATQKAFPAGVTGSAGVGSDAALFGFITITTNSLYPEGFKADIYGSAFVHINGIFPMGIPPPRSGADNSEMGHPILNPAQFISFPINNPTMDFLVIPKPRLSPYTIYAPRGATQQARDNHPPGREEFMDEQISFGTAIMPLFGSAMVSNKNRRLIQKDTAGIGGFLAMGHPTVTPSPQHVYLDGIKSFKYGIPRVNNGQELQVFGFPMDGYGHPSVAFIPEQDRQLPIPGSRFDDYGNAIVSNFIRYCEPAGIDSAALGEAWPQHPPPPAYPEGMDAMLWGTALVAYRIRHLDLDGFDSFECDYTIGQFADRMRLIRMNPRLSPASIDTMVFGTAGVGLFERSIGVQGIPVGPIAVSIPLLSKRNIVSLVGYSIDSVEFGDVQRWEAGKIKPQGEDFFDAGVHMLARTIVDVTLGSISQVPNPSVASSIGVAGLDSSEYGRAVAMAFGCGEQARALHGWDSLEFGIHGILFAPGAGESAAIGFSSEEFGVAFLFHEGDVIYNPGDGES